MSTTWNRTPAARREQIMLEGDRTDYRAMLARHVATVNGNRSGYFHTPAAFVEWEENIGKLWREEFEAAEQAVRS